jgi:DNA-binding NtrC family response regulator
MPGSGKDSAIEKKVYESYLYEFAEEPEQMSSIMKVVDEVAKFDLPVLIGGETGTGKELLARIIHDRSPRREKPFVAVDCSDSTAESFAGKLFGHEAGFFGAGAAEAPGKLDAADKGVLFLDDVGRMPLSVQGELVRFLDTGEFKRLGGAEPVKANVRVIAATSIDLAREVEADRFNKGLFYHLQVVPLTIPPLRARPSSISRLIEYFLTGFLFQYRKPRITFSPEAMNILANYDWPGNVRQLRKFVERIFVSSEPGAVISPPDLPNDFFRGLSGMTIASLGYARRQAEREAILNALRHAGSNREEAARLLQISPRTLRYKINQLGIRADVDPAKGQLSIPSSKL